MRPAKEFAEEVEELRSIYEGASVGRRNAELREPTWQQIDHEVRDSLSDDTVALFVEEDGAELAARAINLLPDLLELAQARVDWDTAPQSERDALMESLAPDADPSKAQLALLSLLGED